MIRKLLMLSAAIAFGMYATKYVATKGWGREWNLPGGAGTVAALGLVFLSMQVRGSLGTYAAIGGAAAFAPFLLAKATEASSGNGNGSGAPQEDHRFVRDTRAHDQQRAESSKRLNRYVEHARA